MGPAEVKEKLGVEPRQVTDYLTLVGDASDNIKGAKGIGPKTAAGILGYFGSLDGMYNALWTRAKREAASNRHSGRASKSCGLGLTAVRSLVRMRTDVPLDVAEVFRPRVPKVAAQFMEEGDKVEAQDQVEATAPPTPPAAPQRAPRSVELAPAQWERGLEPRSMDEACLLAKRLHDSRMFSAYGTPQAVLSTVMLGRELGMPAMAALRSVHIIEGKHSLSADLMVALVLKSGLAEYFQLVESTDEVCTFSTHRKGAPQETLLSYTIEQAEQAGLLFVRPGKQPGNWQKIREADAARPLQVGTGPTGVPGPTRGSLHAGGTARC